MTGRNLGTPIYERLRRICRESLIADGVTTRPQLNVGRLPAA